MHIATDGETYGHHHQFGDMALAYALQLHRSQQPGAVSPTTANTWSSIPPTHEVQIIENSSWSCAHGVERWRSNCGCNSGGMPDWNQEWRAPAAGGAGLAARPAGARYSRTRRGKYLKDPWRRATTTSRSSSTARPENLDAFLRASTPSGELTDDENGSAC